jgi:hypothetical protein
MIMETLPASPDERLEYLRRAAKHGEDIGELAKVGAPAAGVRSYAEQAPDLSMTETDSNRIIIRYGDLVRWIITVDDDDVIQGYGFSGFKDLMEELEIDFSGGKYEAG